MENVRIYEMPPCKMVSSGAGMFGEPKFDRFDAWFGSLPRATYPMDYLFQEPNGKFNWLYRYEEGLEVPDEFTLIDFPGGLYGVATGVDGQPNEAALGSVIEFAQSHGFTPDTSRAYLGNVISSPTVAQTLGYAQMDYYVPLVVAADAVEAG